MEVCTKGRVLLASHQAMEWKGSPASLKVPKVGWESGSVQAFRAATAISQLFKRERGGMASYSSSLWWVDLESGYSIARDRPLGSSNSIGCELTRFASWFRQAWTRIRPFYDVGMLRPIESSRESCRKTISSRSWIRSGVGKRREQCSDPPRRFPRFRVLFVPPSGRLGLLPLAKRARTVKFVKVWLGEGLSRVSYSNWERRSNEGVVTI